MSPTNQCLRHRHHFGSYILANDKSWPRQYVDCNQSHQIDCLQMRVTIEEVEDIEEGHGSDGEFNEGFIELGSDIIDAGGSCEAAVDDAIIATDFVEEDEAVVVMEDEHRVDVQLEVNDEVGIAPKLIGFGRDNKVQKGQSEPSSSEEFDIAVKVMRWQRQGSGQIGQESNEMDDTKAMQFVAMNSLRIEPIQPIIMIFDY